MCKFFVSIFNPELTIEDFKAFCSDIIGDDYSVEKLTTKYPSYSFFLITCDITHKVKLLNPQSWEEGVLIRSFYGEFKCQDQE